MGQSERYLNTWITGTSKPRGTGTIELGFYHKFDKIGYVKDNDASKIDYNELLKQLQKETSDANLERSKLGYAPINLVGWASKPHYDSNKKVLHWAKELRFGNDSINTLNYNLRVLGKEGIFILNAVASMNELNEVKPTIDKVLASVDFDIYQVDYNINPKQLDIKFVDLKTDSINGIIPMILG